MKNYYEVGDRDNIVISNSSLTEINPEQGGCPQQFLEFFKERKEKNKAYLNLGKVVHDYAESPMDFAVEELDRPGEHVFNLCNLLYEEYKKGTKIDFETAFKIKNENNLMGNVKKFDTFSDKFKKEGMPYFKFLKNNGHKTLLTAPEKEKLVNCQESLRSNAAIYQSIFAVPENKDIVIYNEIALFCKTNISINVDNKEIAVELKLKGLIDRLEIHPHNQNPTIYVKDLKTTGKPLSLFEAAIERWRYHRQLAFYIFLVQLYMMGKGGATTKDGEIIEIKEIKINKDSRVYSDLNVVESHGYYNSAVVPINYEWLKKGSEEYMSLLKRIAWHKHTNNWNQQMEVNASNGRMKIKDPT